PNPSWLWGHELQAFERPSGDFYTECIQAHGSAYRIKGALGVSILVLSDPGGLSHMFRNIYNYPHSAVFRPLIDRLLGRGLVWVEGEKEHKRMRHLANLAFSAESVKRMAPAIWECAGKLQTRMTSKALNGNGTMTVNILDFCSGATLDVIGKVGFDHDFEQGSSLEAKRIASSWRAQVALGLERTGFIATLTLRLFPFITSLPFETIQAQGEIKTIIKELASKLVQRESNSPNDGNNLLSILMRASLAEKEPMPQDELLDHVRNQLVGHETTSTSLSYTIWELARNSEKQQRLRGEALAFTGEPTYEELQTKLPYLDACCKEGLRLHPPSAHMERVAEGRDVIPLSFPVTKSDGSQCSSIVVEEGQLIYVPSISINRLTSIWGDGEAFRPERWLESTKGPSNVKLEGWSNIFTFSDGPRNCVGYRLAVFEWKVLMFTLIRNFIFEDTGAKIISRFSSTLQPRVVGKESEGIQMPIKVTLA
ncbi:cytochrome P450, partial [Ramaria rubella]